MTTWPILHLICEHLAGVRCSDTHWIQISPMNSASLLNFFLVLDFTYCCTSMYHSVIHKPWRRGERGIYLCNPHSVWLIVDTLTVKINGQAYQEEIYIHVFMEWIWAISYAWASIFPTWHPSGFVTESSVSHAKWLFRLEVAFPETNPKPQTPN